MQHPLTSGHIHKKHISSSSTFYLKLESHFAFFPSLPSFSLVSFLFSPSFSFSFLPFSFSFIPALLDTFFLYPLFLSLAINREVHSVITGDFTPHPGCFSYFLVLLLFSFFLPYSFFLFLSSCFIFIFLISSMPLFGCLSFSLSLAKYPISSLMDGSIGCCHNL